MLIGPPSNDKLTGASATESSHRLSQALTIATKQIWHLCMSLWERAGETGGSLSRSPSPAPRTDEDSLARAKATSAPPISRKNAPPRPPAERLPPRQHTPPPSSPPVSPSRSMHIQQAQGRFLEVGRRPTPEHDAAAQRAAEVTAKAKVAHAAEAVSSDKARKADVEMRDRVSEPGGPQARELPAENADAMEDWRLEARRQKADNQGSGRLPEKLQSDRQGSERLADKQVPKSKDSKRRRTVSAAYLALTASLCCYLEENVTGSRHLCQHACCASKLSTLGNAHANWCASCTAAHPLLSHTWTARTWIRSWAIDGTECTISMVKLCACR